MAKFCSNCGFRMEDDDKVCGNCGKPVAVVGGAPKTVIPQSGKKFSVPKIDLKDPKVKQALDAMPETLESLSALKDTLEKNSDLMNLLHSLASENVLAALQAFSSSADAQTLMTDLAENADALLPDLQKYIAFGKEYGLFTDAAEGMDVSLLFVYMTPSLHPAPENTTEPVTENVPWYKKILGRS